MILDDITLYNFGLYSGRQTISLTPASPSKPVILLGGLNGGGKTTFLDALQLCLFGAHARISNRGPLAYGEYLRRSIHRGADTAEASIEVSFRHTNEGHEDSYRVLRSWQLENGGCKDVLTIWRNDVMDIGLAENWPTQVEDFIPPNIAHLFLFDGEQIEGYASYDHSSELIGSAIQNLLGLDIVDQLEKDLIVYERRKRSEKKNDKAIAVIQDAEKELGKLRDRTQELNQERASIQTHGIDRAQRAVSKVEEEYRKIGGLLYDQRVELEEKMGNLEKAVRQSAAEQRDIAAGMLPLVIVRDLLESSDFRDRLEEEGRLAREVANVLQARDREALKTLRVESVSEEAVEAIKVYFRKDRAKRRSLGKRQTMLDLLPETRSDLHALLRNDLDCSVEKTEAQVKRHKENEENLELARTEFESIPSAEAIEEVAKKRAKLRKELGIFKAQHVALSSEIDRVYREIERKEQALIRLHEAEVKAVTEHDDRERILRHASKVRGTVNKFRKAVVERHVRRIEQLVLGSYHQLLRKSSLVTQLAIDPDQFTITLYGSDRKVLTADRLSAGERQLLGIALLWGLAKVSGRPLPTAIDTPLGRLDASHRMHMVERYFPFASHQVLLLSTDEEIAGDYLDRLKPWIGKSYYLNYEDGTGKTRIVPGYFSKVEAA